MAVKAMPSFNVDSLLEDDKKLEELGGYPFRFGYAFDVDYTLADGNRAADGDYAVWSLRFLSKGACSLNFGFSELALSPEAELYVYSADGSMVYGPVTAEQNTTDGWLYTIPVSGEDVIIRLIEPSSAKEQSRLTVSQVIHGYKNVTPSSEDALALACYNDVCSYSAYTDYSDAVCRILLSGSTLCIGALINNTKQDFTPYVLTANHCMQGSSVPINWTFQFKYKSCATSVSFNYADTKATWNRTSGTDFLLVLMRSSLDNQNLTFLGWDRTTAAPSSAATIHHPAGAQMKISFANNPAIVDNYFWRDTFQNGSAERGSSGSPLFNQNNRVIGQLWTGPDIPICPPVPLWFGRFDQSWTGNGTSATRLSNWLDPSSTGAQTLNLMPMFNLSGPSVVPCSGTVTYSIPQTRASGINISWTTGSSGIQIVSGQGTQTITVRAISSSSSSGKITATFTYGGKSFTLSKAVDIGAPNVASVNGPSTAGTGSYVSYTALPKFSSSQGSYQWMVSPSTASYSTYENTCDVTFNSAGTYAVGARTSTSCTSPGSYTMMTVSVGSSYIVSSGVDRQVWVSPSTVGGAAPVVADPNQTVAYSLYSQATGALAASGRLSALGGTLDFSSVPDGIYLLRLDTGNGMFDTHRVLLK
jgi:hypothetical protein